MRNTPKKHSAAITNLGRLAAAALMTLSVVACSGNSTGDTTSAVDRAHDPYINPACPRDNLVCPNGTIVMRSGASCEFICPQDTAAQANCDYAAADRRYFSRYAQMCARIPANCQKGESYFNDACGCGCRREPQHEI